MKIDGVFSGGGVKAFAFVGALKSLEKNQLELERMAGTSAGAIVASLVAAGYHLEDIEEALDNSAPINKVPSFHKMVLLIFSNGFKQREPVRKMVI